MNRVTGSCRGLERRVRRAVQQHGVLGMLGLAVEHIARLGEKLRPSVRAEIREREQRAAAFDERYGIDTGGYIHPTALNINSPNQMHAVSYGGSDPRVFRDAIGALSIEYSRFVFIDFGSGKGRALLLASEFPFKRIVGVEFSDELHRIAQGNIKRFPRDLCKCKEVESVCMDVVDYPLPVDCLVCYFCNPFDTKIMGQVLSHIQASVLRKPREVFIVYYNPKAAQLLDQAGCFSAVGKTGNIRVWQTTVDSPASDIC